MLRAKPLHSLASRASRALLCLALLLPLAQTAGWVHALSHDLGNAALASAEGRPDDGANPGAESLADLCELCVAATALGGAAPLPSVQAWVGTVAGHLAPLGRSSAAPDSAPYGRPAARGPPAAAAFTAA